ncbi:MAG: acyl-coenzyme A synthetase/AMP-(fatty) acid ligase, partial [Myxococcota bacterium]
AYWNLPEQSSAAFVDDYYRTGDVVIEEAGENFRFVGRRDRMVKKRGYRVELGEIEAALSNHPDVDQAAVVAISDQETGVTIHAHLGLGELEKISLIALKRFCSQRLPAYMIPDKFMFHPSLPMTSTDKVDYQKLQNEAN